jgi:ABC-type nitrate/sulfonate/bicarbonate transport system substrate-binding protein
MEQVHCGYATEGQGVTPLAAALEAGSMREQGLDVSLSKLGNAHAVAKALEDGDIRFGNLAAPGPTWSSWRVASTSSSWSAGQGSR